MLNQYASQYKDQAAGLRRMMQGPKPRIISVLSAASGQNQPRILTNLAASIFQQGKDVLIMHAAKASEEAMHEYDLQSLPTLVEVALRHHSLGSALKKSLLGYTIAQLGLRQQQVSEYIKPQLEQLMHDLAGMYEFILLDAMLNDEDMLPLSMLNQSDILVQMTGKPESIKQAYLMIKQLCSQVGRRNFGILVNQATEKEALKIFTNIQQVANTNLGIALEFFGAIPKDEHLSQAAKVGRSVVDAFPKAISSTAIKSLATRLNYHSQTASTRAISLI